MICAAIAGELVGFMWAAAGEFAIRLKLNAFSRMGGLETTAEKYPSVALWRASRRRPP